MKTENLIKRATGMICDYFGINPPGNIAVKSRNEEIVIIRKIISYVLRAKKRLTYEEIGEILNLDHSTIVYNYKYIDWFVNDKIGQKVAFRGKRISEIVKKIMEIDEKHANFASGYWDIVTNEEIEMYEAKRTTTSD